MSEKDLINFPNRGIIEAINKTSLTRAKSFKIRTSPSDFKQYAAAVNAYASAGMPFEHLANAGDFLGDEVERKEIDAPLKQDWRNEQVLSFGNKAGEVVEGDNQITAWQTRGEKVSTIPELSAPQPVTGQEIINISKDLTTIEPAQEKTIDVIEGINVSLSQDASSALPNSALHDQELENNPYLQPIAGDLKKAA